MNFSSGSYTRQSMGYDDSFCKCRVGFLFQVLVLCAHILPACMSAPSEEGVGSPELELDGSEHTGRELVLCMNKGSAPGH